MSLKTFSAFLLALVGTACSNQQIYTAVQESQRIDCGKLQQPQYEECMRELETPYDEYERERQEVVGDGKSP